MKQSELQLQKYLEKYVFESSKNIEKSEVLEFSHILYFAINCDLMLEAYEDCLAEKYDVLVPYSQLFRNIDMFSLPVLDALIDEHNQIKQFTKYSGEFKRRWHDIYKSVENSDISAGARTKDLSRKKLWWSISDKKIFPYKILIDDGDLKMPIVYKQIIYILTEFVPKDLPLALNKLETKQFDENDFPKTLNDLIGILRKVKNGIETFAETNQRLQKSIFRNKRFEVEELIGELILFKQVEQIVPISQLRGLNDTNFSKLYAVKTDFNSSLLRQIDQESWLFFSKTLLASLIYSIDTEERYFIWKKLNAKLKTIQEKMRKEYNLQDLNQIKSYFGQPKVKTFLSTLGTTDLQFIEKIQNPTKIYFYLRFAKKDPLSRGSNINTINEKFRFLKGAKQ